MKKWRKQLIAAGVGCLLMLPVAVEAKDFDNYAQFSDVDIREQVLNYSLQELDENFETASENLDTEFVTSENNLGAAHANERAAMNQLYDELEAKKTAGEVTDEEYDVEYQKLTEAEQTMNERQDKEADDLEERFTTKIDELEGNYERDRENYESYAIITQSSLATVDYIGIEPWREFPSITGLELLPNLKRMIGEISGESTYGDIRPLLETKNLEKLDIPISNQTTLNAFKNLTKLKMLNIAAGGFANYEERERIEDENLNKEPMFTEALLTDISALSNATNLERLDIHAEGALRTITLKAGTTSYQLYEPFILSSQFDGAEIEYVSYFENSERDYYYHSDEWLQWDELTGEEEYLAFEFCIIKGKSSYSGIGHIPIRWK